MSKQIWDVGSSNFGYNTLGGFFDFQTNNVFYLMAPEYYQAFYSIYLNRCISVFDGWVQGFHKLNIGYVPQRLLQSISTGLTNMLFADGIDFSGDKNDYNFAVKWAKQSDLLNNIKKGYKHAVAGGTSILKINRKNKELYVTPHRIDNFFIDIDGSGEIVSGKIFFDAIHNTNPAGTDVHYGLCEERYFNEENIPCIKTSIYAISGNLQTEKSSRQFSSADIDKKSLRNVSWDSLPKEVKKYVKENYPDILIGLEQYLPFKNTLGLYKLMFTEDIPQLPMLPFGQPIGDILFTESFQYDQLKYFEKNEVDIARARVLIPEEMWNKDDPNYEEDAMSDRYFQKLPAMTSGGDSDKPIPQQFNYRSEDIAKGYESILKNASLKIQVSSSSVASFLSEGTSAKTATEIINERTKSDTWIKSTISLNINSLNKMMKTIMYFYNKGEVEIILKSEDQSPFLDRLEVNSMVFQSGNMSPTRFVKDTYRNLSQTEIDAEIKHLEETKMQKDAFMQTNVRNNEKNV